MNIKRKQLAKIYNRIMQIVTSCVDTYITYYKYIDDILANNQYLMLQDVFSICFKCDITRFNSITVLKRETYEIAKMFTNTYYQINLKGFYDANNVYQIGHKIYDSTNNSFLGEFHESYRLEEVYHNGVTYSYYPNNIYYRNTCLFHKLDESKAIELTVYVGHPDDDGEIYLLNDIDMKLIDKYKLAVSLLKAGDIKHYIDVDYAFKYFV